MRAENLEGWPLWSGSEMFPVPAPADFAMGEVHAFDELPRWSGQYGLNRRSLLAYLIAEISLELDSRGAA